MKLGLRICGFILAFLAGASAYALNVMAPPILLGPTTFSTFSKSGSGSFDYDLIYLQHETNPQLRKLGTISCKSSELVFETALNLGLEENLNLGSQSGHLAQDSQMFCSGKGPVVTSFAQASVSTEFDLWDKKVISSINRTFYQDIHDFGTLSLQHGHPTETVYVFIPGLYMNGKQFLHQAAGEFWRGSNVLVATLPGHQNATLSANENDIGSWLTYTDFLVSIARHYGKKVIVVGQSTGGTLAVRAAENNKVDGLVLFQPFFGLSKTITAAMELGKLLPESWLDRMVDRYNVLETLKIGIEDQKLLAASFQKISATLPVELILAGNDSVVSTDASIRWAKKYAPHAQITNHEQNHMFVMSPTRLQDRRRLQAKP